MIRENLAMDGTPTENLTFSSKKQVTKICDLCGEEKIVSWNTVARCRKKHNTTLDYCFSCSMKVYNAGENNPAKNTEVRQKISDATKGKSKSFKDGKNLRILDRKISSDGHILKWVDGEKKHIQEHRLVYAESTGKHHSELDEIHHINGHKIDNSLSNLIELSGSEHGTLHSQLEALAFELVQKKIILFDRLNRRYILSPQIESQTWEKSLGFENIAIKQQKNICFSRLDVDIESEIIRGIKRPIPLIAANMSTVVNTDFCIQLYKNGALGILHRADAQENILKNIKDVAKECDIVAASIGIDENQFDFSKLMIKNGCNVIVIDIAHGYSDVVLEMAKKIKKFSPSTKLVIGNATNINILLESYDFVDAIKVGIAQGLACETKNTAGCTEKQFSAIFKFKQLSKDFGIPIISDGGIREPADFTKAIAAGANSVMAGSIFAACPESAAPFVYINGVEKKLYAGMASRYVQDKWKGGLKSGTCPEGTIRHLDVGEPLLNLLDRYSGALKSGITYAGAKDINRFQNVVDFVLLQQ